jgi:anti-sigma regulatory factor (Ser/Thr protein kinase)
MATEEGGRGFAFMSALTDQMELNVEADGTVVELRKRRGEKALVVDA